MRLEEYYPRYGYSHGPTGYCSTENYPTPLVLTLEQRGQGKMTCDSIFISDAVPSFRSCVSVVHAVGIVWPQRQSSAQEASGKAYKSGNFLLLDK